MANKRDRPRRKVKWWLLLAIFVLMIAAAWVVSPLVRSLFTDQFRLYPNAKIKADETYDLQLWVERPVLPDTTPWQAGIDQAVSDFHTLYPNINIALTHLTPGEADSRLNDALDKGNPPDVYFSANSSQCDFGDLQLALSRFVDKQERTGWADSLWRQVTTGDTAYSLPVAAYPQVFMINTRLFERTGLDPATLLQTPWSWGDLLAAAEKATIGKVYGYVPTSTGEALLRNLAASLGKPAAFSGDGKLVWTKEDLMSMAQLFEQLRQSKGLPDTGANMDANCLDLFLGQKATIIGPVNHHLADWLWKAAADKGIDARLVPIPSLASSKYSDVRVVGISLFRQSEYQGSSHTRAAAELAQYLVPKLGALLSSLTGALPATSVAQAAEFLPYDQESFSAYAQISRAPALTYAYGPQVGLSETHWDLGIKDAWEKLVWGNVNAEQFAEAVLAELSQATIAGP